MNGPTRHLLAPLLLAGGCLLLHTAAPAVAQSVDPQTPTGSAAALQTADLPSDPFDLTDEEIDILQALAVRREALAEKERDLAARADLLKAAEARVAQKIAALEALKQEIETLVAAHRAESRDRIDGLVKIYATMKPKEAARILADMEMPVLIPVMQAMPARNAAAILAEMQPQKAESITVQMAATDDFPIAGD